MPARLRDRPSIRVRVGALCLLLALVCAAPAAAQSSALLTGSNTHSWKPQVPEADGVREIAAIRGMGGDVVRFDVEWSQIETSKGVYREEMMGKLDRLLTAASQRGVQTVVMLHQTPCWASTAPADLKLNCDGDAWRRGVYRYPPANPSDYADFLGEILRRYGSKITAVEVWNEPNTSQFLISADPARDYMAMLRPAYSKAKSINRSVKILAGAMARADGDFLKRLYAYGLRGRHDGVSFHPYAPTPTSYSGVKRDSYVQGVPWIQQIVSSYGEGSKGLWLTEVGYSTCSHPTECTSEQTQASHTAKLIDLAQGWSYVRALLIYELRNGGTDIALKEQNFGLLRRDFSPKPAYHAFAASVGVSAPPAP